MQCCESGYHGGEEIHCDKEEDHEGPHQAHLFINRECDGMRLVLTAEWDAVPCPLHPKGAHVSEEYKAQVKGGDEHA
jgi:hypothetical protein